MNSPLRDTNLVLRAHVLYVSELKAAFFCSKETSTLIEQSTSLAFLPGDAAESL